MPSYPDEETNLLGGQSKKCVAKTTINIEWFRFWGLLGGAVLLAVGASVTMLFTKIPDEYSAYYDWDTNSIRADAPQEEWHGGFKYKQTLIFRLFHFNHSCTFLDFNPSKTVAALVIMFHVVPCNIFVFLDYLRIMNDSTLTDGLKWFTKYASPFQFLVIQYFFLVFVNSPYGDANGDTDANKAAMNRFIAHYIPYVLWQTGMFVMSVQQVWYISEKDDMVPLNAYLCCGPVNERTKPSRRTMKLYLYFLFAMLVVYTAFVTSFIIGRGGSSLWCTDLEKGCVRGNFMAKVIMVGFDFFAVIIPTAFSWAHIRAKSQTCLLEFSTLD